MILIVEDNQDLCRLWQVYLESNGHKAAFVHSGNEALQALNGNPLISLMTCDLRLPDITGLDLITKARLLLPHLPCVLVTGELGASWQQVRNLKNTACLLKPFRLIDLLKTIEDLLKKP